MQKFNLIIKKLSKWIKKYIYQVQIHLIKKLRTTKN